jgi:hypothetical protein
MASETESLNLSNAEQILYSTVFIETLYGDSRATGTAFFNQFTMPNGRSAVSLVSCRHVLEGAQAVRLWCPIQTEDGQPSDRHADITLRIDGKATVHPNPDIDLAGVIIHHIEKAPFLKGEKLFYRALSEALIPDHAQWENLSVADPILVPGCPAGLFEERDRTPFFRRGIIASLPRDSLRPHFYIDMPTIDGSSGSPVIIDSHFSYNRKGGGYELRSRFYLIGIVTDGLEVSGHNGNQDLHFGKVVRANNLRQLNMAILKDTRERENK